MEFSVFFAGTGGSMPTQRRGLPALLIRRGGDRILVDCGEGTQRQLLSSIGLTDVDEIFITHLHADHYLGLPGMLKTFALRQRDTPLTVYGPSGLRDLYSSLGRVFGKLSYPVQIEELLAGAELQRDEYRILAFPVDHGVSAVGYALVEDERPGRFDVEKAEALGIPPGPERGALQRGETVTLADGRVIAAETVVGAARPGRRIVIPGDTAPTETVRVLAGGADVLVHEATFTDEDAGRAAETMHSTARQAAEVAEAAHVRLLALTHVSPRYLGSELLREAREIFPDTVLPRDFDTIEVPFAERGAPHLVKGGALPDPAVREPLYPASAQPL
jgi:ribonuclease Z